MLVIADRHPRRRGGRRDAVTFGDSSHHGLAGAFGLASASRGRRARGCIPSTVTPPPGPARANKGPGRRRERAGPAARTSPMPASSAHVVAEQVGDQVDGAGVVVQVDLAVSAEQALLKREDLICGQGRGRTADLPLFRCSGPPLRPVSCLVGWCPRCAGVGAWLPSRSPSSPAAGRTDRRWVMSSTTHISGVSGRLRWWR
jgi:hypothetical protein